MSQSPSDEEPTTGFRADVSYLYGRLVGDADNHPNSGLLQALDVKGGLRDWVEAHPPPDQPSDSE